MKSMLLYGEEEGETYLAEEMDAEDDYLAGFEYEEDVEECEECGAAIRDKGISREINGEMFNFCCRECADEYEESVM